MAKRKVRSKTKSRKVSTKAAARRRRQLTRQGGVATLL